MRLLTAFRGAAIVAGSALIATLVLALVANYFAFSTESLTGTRLLLFLSIAFAVGFGIAMPLLRLNRRGTAHQVERKYPEFEERLVTFAETEPEPRQDPFLELL